MRTALIKRIALLVMAACLPLSAVADPIVELIEGGEGVNPLGGYEMTMFATPEGGACASSTGSPIEGQVDFEQQDGSSECMAVEDPDWWEWDHGNIFVTNEPWVELIMPANTRAFWVYVGGSFSNGAGWIQAHDSEGATTTVNFGRNTDIPFGPGKSPGFGVYSPDSCKAITKVIIEPPDWGMGYFAINQDPCVGVPEPAPVGLLGLGLLALAFSRKLTNVKKSDAVS